MVVRERTRRHERMAGLSRIRRLAMLPAAVQARTRAMSGWASSQAVMALVASLPNPLPRQGAASP
jgi:hypothetical protein